MREDNLLCVAKRKFVVTTDSAHGLKVYPNLPPSLILTGVNQLWMADITYIRLEEEFVYPGGDSGCVFAAGDRLDLDDAWPNRLTLAALRWRCRSERCGLDLVHHSDRGGQYAAATTRRLAEGQRHRHQHESQGKPLGQCGLRIVHEDAQTGRGIPNRIQESGRRAGCDRRVPGEGLQRKAAALGAGLPFTGAV